MMTTNMKLTDLAGYLMDEAMTFASNLNMIDILVVLGIIAAATVILDVISRNEKVRKIIEDLMLLGIVILVCQVYAPEYVQLLLIGIVSLAVLSMCIRRTKENLLVALPFFKKELTFLAKFLKNALWIYVKLFKDAVNAIQKWYLVKTGHYRCDNDVLYADVIKFPTEK